jgi:protein-tyrosine-phosphatase
MTAERTVLFVCLHGAGMSRIAAAFFNRTAPAGWRALSAGVDPAETLSPTAESLLAGTGADDFLDRSPPRPVAAIAEPRRVIALRNPAIQYALASSAETWDLEHSSGAPLRDEIQLRAETLARSLGAT